MAVEIVFGRDAEVAAWVAERVPEVGPAGFGPCVAFGVAVDGEPAAGIVFSQYRGHDMHMSIASTSPRWCSRRVLRAVFLYAFDQHKCARVTALTAKTNKAARAMLERLGFKLEGTHPAAFPNNVTACSYGMLRRDCRWIGG